MLSDILWSSIILAFIIFGLTKPYIALCGVIWVDVLKPQDLSFSFLAGKPLSLIITLIFFMSIVLNFKKLSFPAKKASTFTLLIFMIWVTITTYYAEFQFQAWHKYDYSIKTMLFALFIPFVLNSKHKIETFVAVVVAALSYYMLIGGWRTLMGGGGYGTQLIPMRVADSGITETSTLSMLGVIMLPLLYYLYKNSIFVQRTKALKFILLGIGFSSFVTTIGTYARTGLIGLFILLGQIVLKSKHKFRIIIVLLVAIVSIAPFLPDSWSARMSTISSAEEDSSALGRIVVWRWTLDYVAERPIMGGGFDSYLANNGVLHLYNDNKGVAVDYKNGKAFHNIYFEVLGEHGYVGLSIYLLLIYLCWKLNRTTLKQHPPDSWAAQLASATNIALLIYCACGMFIGIAFAPWLYYLLGIAASLQNIPTTIQPTKKPARFKIY